MEKFHTTCRDLLVPEILDAFMAGNLIGLRKLCSDAVYGVLEATLKPYIDKGLVMGGKILDMRNFDVVGSKLVDDNPVVVTPTGQGVHEVVP